MTSSNHIMHARSEIDSMAGTNHNNKGMKNVLTVFHIYTLDYCHFDQSIFFSNRLNLIKSGQEMA